jgi:hypothetical protein
MSSDSGGNGNSRIDVLRKRQAALRDQLARELVRQQKKIEREEARVHSIVGQALIRNAAKHPDFELMLKGILKSATSFSDGDKKLLRAKGWL